MCFLCYFQTMSLCIRLFTFKNMVNQAEATDGSSSRSNTAQSVDSTGSVYTDELVGMVSIVRRHQ